MCEAERARSLTIHDPVARAARFLLEDEPDPFSTWLARGELNPLPSRLGEQAAPEVDVMEVCVAPVGSDLGLDEGTYFGCGHLRIVAA